MKEKTFEELKPCPFCGGVAEFKPYGKKGLTLKCNGCKVQFVQKVLRFSIEWLEIAMTKQWNKRCI